MTYFFLDTSGLVRAYTNEPGSRRLGDLITSATRSTPSIRVVVCDLAYPEACAALGQRLARRDIGIAEHARARAAIEQHILSQPSPFIVLSSSPVMGHAGALATARRLRGSDAVHIAAAKALRDSLASDAILYFVSTDGDQNKAALAEGFSLYDIEASRVLHPSDPTAPLPKLRR